VRPRIEGGDWTPASGLRELVLSLALKGAVAAAAWCGLLLLAFTDDRGLFFGSFMGLVVGLVAGVPLGFVMGYRLNERAGFTGPAVLFGAYGGTLAAGILGSALAGAITGNAVDFVALPAGAFGSAMGVILRLTLVES
jgi:hypothetical protein